jgi:tRNA pseudouridine38-40 synthase
VTAAQRRWRLDLSYNGAGFHGFAVQPGVRTVAGEVAAALAVVLRLDGPPPLTCAGRTDAGVHAVGQVVHVDLPEPLFTDVGGDDATRLVRSCNKLLAPHVVVLACAPAAAGFDARHSATSRSYRYLVFEADAPSPLLEAVAWHCGGPLDLRAMAQGALALLGEHDFRAFCRRPSGADASEPIVRRVTAADVAAVDDALGVTGGGRLVRIDLTATAFCHQMVRSIVSTLVAIGRGGLTGADLVAYLHAGERTGLPAPAPACGLCLMAVAYE